MTDRTAPPLRRAWPASRDNAEASGLPRHVKRELYGYLGCGILAHGAARVACSSCKDSILVAFSCRGRGLCPSCDARRMSDTAAHLVDRVFPHVPVRQWVLSLPFRLRFLCARDPSLLREVLRLFFSRPQGHVWRSKPRPPRNYSIDQHENARRGFATAFSY